MHTSIGYKFSVDSDMAVRPDLFHRREVFRAQDTPLELSGVWNKDLLPLILFPKIIRRQYNKYSTLLINNNFTAFLLNTADLLLQF